MIDRAFKYIADRLNQQMREELQYQDNLVTVSNLKSSGPGLPPQCNNRLILSVFNVELETQLAPPKRPLSKVDRLSMVREPTSFDIGFLLVSNFEDYTNALAFLSRSVGYFQDKPSFRQSDGGTFPMETSLIQIEALKLSLEEQQRIWSMLGIPYLPSMAYRARIISE